MQKLLLFHRNITFFYYFLIRCQNSCLIFFMSTRSKDLKLYFFIISFNFSKTGNVVPRVGDLLLAWCASGKNYWRCTSTGLSGVHKNTTGAPPYWCASSGGGVLQLLSDGVHKNIVDAPPYWCARSSYGRVGPAAFLKGSTEILDTTFWCVNSRNSASAPSFLAHLWGML
jgi:hypothetical protein